MNDESKLLDELNGILQQQRKALKQDEFDHLEQLMDRSKNVIEKLSKMKSIDPKKQKKMMETYGQLTLIVESQMAQTEESLQKIRKARKTLKAYQ